MKIKSIKNKTDYNQAIIRLEKIWGAKSGTSEGDELEALATLIDKYEEESFPIAPPDNE